MAPTISNRRNMILLFASLVVVMLGFGLIIPILPFYIDAMGASGTDLGLLMATFALMQLIFAPIWGSLSDHIGRKPVLMIGIFGNALSQLLLGLSTQLWMLFAARALAGVLSSATLPTAMAFVGDSTSDEDRGGGMGIMGAAMGLGMVLGPGLGGWLAERSLSLPFFVAAALSMLILVFVFLMLPESLPLEQRIRDGRKFSGPDFRQMARALAGPMGYLFFLAFLLSFGMTNFEGVFGLYALRRYDYGAGQVGTILTAIGLTSALVQGGLTGPLTKRWGESRVIQSSLLVSAIGFLLMLGATTFVMVLLTTCFFMVGNAMLRPAVASLISKRATQGQGVAMGLNNSFMSLGRIVGPVWAGALLDYNLYLPYLSGAAIMAIGWLTTLAWLTGSRAQKDAGPASGEWQVADGR